MCHLYSFVRHHYRIQNITRQINQISGVGHSLCSNGSFSHQSICFRYCGKQHRLALLALGFLALEQSKSVRAKVNTFSNRFHVCSPFGIQQNRCCQHCLAHFRLVQSTGCFPCCLAESYRLALCPFATACHNNSQQSFLLGQYQSVNSAHFKHILMNGCIRLHCFGYSAGQFQLAQSLQALLAQKEDNSLCIIIGSSVHNTTSNIKTINHHLSSFL